MGEAYSPCPRAAGGVYRITYTDPAGAVTETLAPAPTGEFAILAPQPGSSVSIPTNGALDVHLALPIPPTGGIVAVDGVDASCWASPCDASFSPYRDLAIPTPSTAQIPSPTPIPRMTCAPRPQSPRVKVSEGQATITLAGDFSAFQPGYGRLEAAMEACVTPTQTGFGAVTVKYPAKTSATINWTR